MPSAHDGNQYTNAIAELRRDPIVIGLANGLTGVPRSDLVTPSGGMRTEFMTAANEEYRRKGGDGKTPRPLGAVGQAVLSLMDTPVTAEELYHGVPDDALQQIADRLALRVSSAKSPEEALQYAKALGEMVTELARRRNT
jgi:hypothetical protein